MARLRKIVVTAALCVSSVVCFAQAALKNRILQPIDKSQMVRLRGNVHGLTLKSPDLGRVDGATQLKNVTLLFNQSASQKAELQALIREQRDPASPNYHKWLTPEQYGERFGMSQADLDKVTGWLKAQGLTVDHISRSRTRLAFNGTTTQVESAFQTEFHKYQVDGRVHLANATEPSVPAALSGSVMGFWKMNDFRWKPRAVAKRVAPRFTLGNDTFLSPADVATIYHIDPLYNSGIDGAGHRIAVVGQTAIKLTDINNFRSAAGLPAKPPVIFLLPGGTVFTNVDDEVEADLDVEWSGAIAKNATIVYVYADQNQAQGGVIGAFEYVIENNIAPVISISYGACEASNGIGFINGLEALMAQADVQGQTVSSSIGDSGATDCEPVPPNATIATTGLAVDVPGAIPDVTAVGGTRFTGDNNADSTFWNSSNDPTTGKSAKSYIPETTWNDGFTSATGGGVSAVIPKPSFQTALTPADGHRDVPDIALSASPDHDPYLVCDANTQNANCAGGFGTALLVGGTSAGAPVFAGMLTLINQATENSGGQGPINPTLYTLAGSPATYASAFHDVTTGNNKQTCKGGSTGCTSANSHVEVAEKHSRLPINAAFFLIPLGAVVLSVRRQRWVSMLGIVVIAAAFSTQIACGGGSTNSNNNNGGGGTPPPNLSIGWSAGTGYDLVTGLGSVDLDNLANAWPGFTGAPAFKLDQTQVTAPTTTVPGVYTITLTRTNGGFSGNVDVNCFTTGDATGDAQATCNMNPQTRTVGAAPAISTLTFNAAHAGIYSVFVTGTDQATGISHSVNVPVTIN